VRSSHLRIPLSPAPLLCVLVVLAACAHPKPTIRTSADPSAQMSSYRTYTFAEHPGTDRGGYSTMITGYFKDAIRSEMDARGYQYVEGDADLLVNFNANAREQVDLRSSPAPTYGYGYYAGYGYYGYRTGMYGVGPSYAAGTEVDTVRYKVGTANVDVADPRKKQLLWEGIAEGRLSDKSMKDPKPAISSLIKEMFAEFPGRAGAQ
jgi:hypothetical protein